MVNNSLVQQQPQSMDATYYAGKEQITLTPDFVRDYLVSGDANYVTYPEVVMFIKLCQYQHLNPFLREAYCIKYGNQKATLCVAEVVLEKRAMANPRYRGFEAGVYVIDQNGNIQTRDGEFYLPGDRVIGGWCKVYVAGYEKPMFAAVTMNEYMGKKKDGSPNQQWANKPATMIRKVAKAHALREAFPEDLSKLYLAEEFGMEQPNEPEIQNPNAQEQQTPVYTDIPQEAVPIQDVNYEEMPSEPIPVQMPQQMPVGDFSADDFTAAMM